MFLLETLVKTPPKKYATAAHQLLSLSLSLSLFGKLAQETLLVGGQVVICQIPLQRTDRLHQRVIALSPGASREPTRSGGGREAGGSAGRMGTSSGT